IAVTAGTGDPYDPRNRAFLLTPFSGPGSSDLTESSSFDVSAVQVLESSFSPHAINITLSAPPLNYRQPNAEPSQQVHQIGMSRTFSTDSSLGFLPVVVRSGATNTHAIEFSENWGSHSLRQLADSNLELD